MSRRKVEEPLQEELHGYGREGALRETHPAFGLATIVRSSGTARALFQSDVKHSESVTLSISQAERTRDLNNDWTHPLEEIVEVEMSLAQWGQLITSIGIGSGVPVTLRRTESVPMVPDLPFQPRLAQNLSEMTDSVEKSLERIRATAAAVRENFDGKTGVKAMREAIQDLEQAIEHAPGNSQYAMKMAQEAAEKVISAAASDIESHVLRASRQLGHPMEIEAPDMSQYRNAGAIEADEKED